VFEHLQIYRRRDRALVGAADLALKAIAPAIRLGRAPAVYPPRTVLLLRLERIGDLLMSLEAIEDVRQAAPAAAIDLVVGSWNVDLARRIRGLRSVETLDADWLTREGNGLPLRRLLQCARTWRARKYDLALNFEPDIRSNMLLAVSRAARTAGFATAGGGPLLDVALEFDRCAHTTANAQRLVAAVLDVPSRTRPATLELAAEERRRAAERTAGRRGPLIGMHVSGGRPIKQLGPAGFADVALRLVREHGATIVLTGSAADRAVVAPVANRLNHGEVVDLAGELDLPSLAAVLEQLDVFISGDTGPMHLAAAVGTPVVAVFGPSDPVRYAPMHPIHRVVRVDLPCSPCNRIRLPPGRCTGHTPDCLAGVDPEMVYRAVERTLDRTGRPDTRVGSARG
jgi:ADP-heptose:LPS heptosyltransferase